MGWSFLIAVCAMVVYVPVRLVAIRACPHVAPVPLYVVVAAVIHLISSIAAALTIQGFSYWHAASAYWFLFMADLFVFGAIYKSLSLSMLRRLWATPRHTLPFSELTEQVALKSFTDRAHLLVAMELATCAEDGFRPTEQGRKIARRIEMVQRLFKISRSGLYAH